MKDRILVRGGKSLSGSVWVQGAKNSALPVLAACALNGGVSVIENCPGLSDTEAMLDILRYIGCRVTVKANTVTVDSSKLKRWDVPRELMHRLRSSIIILGALLARTGKAEVSGPGGCELGARPIDLHLSGLSSLGVDVRYSDGTIEAVRNGTRGGEVVLALPSVGATENLMLYGTCCREGVTVVNAAREPEICDLGAYLSAVGYAVEGVGSAVVRVARGRGTKRHVVHRIIPDRIVSATWLCAVASAGGEAELINTPADYLASVSGVLSRAGCRIAGTEKGIYVCRKGRLRAPGEVIRTGPFPCFPTDAQPLVSSVLATAAGTTVVEENMFENRFSHLTELCRMGADVKLRGKYAVINGVDCLDGRTVTSHDLRGGAALVVAGLSARGETAVLDMGYIDRGYENIVETLRSLGADVERTEDRAIN